MVEQPVLPLRARQIPDVLNAEPVWRGVPSCFGVYWLPAQAREQDGLPRRLRIGIRHGDLGAFTETGDDGRVRYKLRGRVYKNRKISER
ncbi:hypothetical protein ACN6LL_007556 [Streptomyces violaceoruber]